MTETDKKPKKERGVSREEFIQLKQEAQNLRDYVEAMASNSNETLAAIRTVQQQILSYVGKPAAVNEEKRQKFR